MGQCSTHSGKGYLNRERECRTSPETKDIPTFFKTFLSFFSFPFFLFFWKGDVAKIFLSPSPSFFPFLTCLNEKVIQEEFRSHGLVETVQPASYFLPFLVSCLKSRVLFLFVSIVKGSRCHKVEEPSSAETSRKPIRSDFEPPDERNHSRTDLQEAPIGLLNVSS